MEGNIRELCFGTQALGEEISARVLLTGGGVQVIICGGSRTHIGAVSIASGSGQQDMEFPGHRDSVIAKKWAGALKEAGYCPAVVSAGIHYDNISGEEIEAVVALSDALLGKVLDALKEERNQNVR